MASTQHVECMSKYGDAKLCRNQRRTDKQYRRVYLGGMGAFRRTRGASDVPRTVWKAADE